MVLVNGLYVPQITMEAGKFRRFRMVHSGTLAHLEITVPGCDVDLIAKVGAPSPVSSPSRDLARIVFPYKCLWANGSDSFCFCSIGLCPREDGRMFRPMAAETLETRDMRAWCGRTRCSNLIAR